MVLNSYKSLINRLKKRLTPTHLSLVAYLGILKFAANAYVQFAGYSDVAIGLGLTMGFRIQENFQAPFLASNFSDFWKRYHIFLTSWCRDYVFTPLLSLTRQGITAISASMLVLGLWYECSWRYLIWGAVQGLDIIL